MKANIERFNACYYHPDSPPVPSISSPHALMTGIGGVAGEGAMNGDMGSNVEEEPLVPLDLNYLSALGKEVTQKSPSNLDLKCPGYLMWSPEMGQPL